MGAWGPSGENHGIPGWGPMGSHGGGPMGTHGGNPWDPRGGPLGTHWPLGIHWPFGTRAIGARGPWAMGPAYLICGSTLVLNKERSAA